MQKNVFGPFQSNTKLQENTGNEILFQDGNCSQKSDQILGV